jgi:hypothetical protein
MRSWSFGRRAKCAVARRRPPHKPLSVGSSHWRADGAPKVRYGSRAEALSAAYDRGTEEGIELSAYQCDFCDGWHMGRATPRSER